MISCLHECELAIVIVVIAIRRPLSLHLIWMKKYGSAIQLDEQLISSCQKIVNSTLIIITIFKIL